MLVREKQEKEIKRERKEITTPTRNKMKRKKESINKVLMGN
jgi:hypothetical protein